LHRQQLPCGQNHAKSAVKWYHGFFLKDKKICKGIFISFLQGLKPKVVLFAYSSLNVLIRYGRVEQM